MLNIIDAGKKFGSMNSSSINYNNLTLRDKVYLMEHYGAEVLDLRDIDLTPQIRRELFEINRDELGKHYGFSGKKMFMADQVKQDGSAFEITEEYVRDNPNGWTDIPEDILIITDKVPEVVIGHPVADCRVVMVADYKKHAVALAHCSAAFVDKRMPEMVVDALKRAYDSHDDDLIAYIGSGAGKGWQYDNYPAWATDRSLWNEAIYQNEEGKFQIDMRKVIVNQLRKSGVSMITGSTVDTLTDEGYFSNSRSSAKGGNDPSKAGRNFTGTYYSKGR